MLIGRPFTYFQGKGEQSNVLLSLKQSDRNSSKTKLFISLQTMNNTFGQVLSKKYTFARHENGQVFAIKMRSLVQKL